MERKNLILLVVLVCGLVVSSAVNVSVFVRIQELTRHHLELSKSYEKLRERVELYERIEPIRIGREFLDNIIFPSRALWTNLTTGKVLSVKLEQKTWNFYWHHQAGLQMPPNFTEVSTLCWVVAFEKADGQDHVFEVWIDVDTSKVIGGMYLVRSVTLTEWEVREIIREHPGALHLEVKPETVVFRSLRLVPVEESPLAEQANRTKIYDVVWVVEYHIEGRISGEESLFVPMYLRVLIDRYTGERISLEKIDLQVPENILTEEEVRMIITNWSYINLELKPETIEFQSLKLVCLRTTTQTWAWVVEYEIEGRGTGVAVHAATGEIKEPQFHRMSFRVTINAYTGKPIYMDDYRWKWSRYPAVGGVLTEEEIRRIAYNQSEDC